MRYHQLSQPRQFRHEQWVESYPHIQGLVVNDPLWRGPYMGIRDLPRRLNCPAARLPRMSVMVKGLPELPEWELNNLVLTWCGMLHPGNLFTIGVKHLYQDVDRTSFNPFHRGNMVVRLCTEAVADWFIE